MTKKLPNEVSIAIVEREPVGLVSDAGLHVVDADGAVNTLLLHRKGETMTARRKG